MGSIHLHNVGVEFSIYQAGARSLKKMLIAGSTAGNLARDAHDRVMVRALHDISLNIENGDRIGPIMEAAGAQGPPEVNVWRKLATGDDIGW